MRYIKIIQKKNYKDTLTSTKKILTQVYQIVDDSLSLE